MATLSSPAPADPFLLPQNAPLVLCRSSGSQSASGWAHFRGVSLNQRSRGWHSPCAQVGADPQQCPEQGSALLEATQTLEKAFQHSTSRIPLCLPDRIQPSTSGLIKLHCTRLQRTRINRRGRFPQLAKTFRSTKVQEEEITLSKKAGRQSSSAASRDRLQRLRARGRTFQRH